MVGVKPSTNTIPKTELFTRQEVFEMLQGFEAEDWVGSGLELMDDRQFILSA